MGKDIIFFVLRSKGPLISLYALQLPCGVTALHYNLKKLKLSLMASKELWALF